jgi:hypothetical protein
VGTSAFFTLLCFALASLKLKKERERAKKKERKKAKAPSAKEKARIREFLPHSRNLVSEPKAAWQGESKGLE